MNNSFSLKLYEVPVPPESKDWVDHLRWMICVMDYDDTSLPFVAGLLAHCYQNGALSHKQDMVARKIINRVRDMYFTGVLYCQANDDRCHDTHDLADMDAEGEA